MEQGEHTPLPHAEFQILLTLLDGESHGHGIKLEVADRTDGQVVLGPGTLYSAIKRMLENGLIEECSPPDADADERRRYYRITGSGREAAEAEARRMMDLLDVAREKRLIRERQSS
jgi:DNA-binding PadR family transcriptional regulator